METCTVYPALWAPLYWLGWGWRTHLLCAECISPVWLCAWQSSTSLCMTAVRRWRPWPVEIVSTPDLEERSCSYSAEKNLAALRCADSCTERATERVERQDYKKEWWMEGRSRGYDTAGSYERWENGVTVGVVGCRSRGLQLDEYIFCRASRGGVVVQHRHLITHPLHFVFKAQRNIIDCHTHTLTPPHKAAFKEKGNKATCLFGPRNRFNSQRTRVGGHTYCWTQYTLCWAQSKFGWLLRDAVRAKSSMTSNRRPLVGWCC